MPIRGIVIESSDMSTSRYIWNSLSCLLPATCAELASQKWTVVKDPSVGKVSVHDIVPVLPTTKKWWMSTESSYHAIQRLPDGRWLAFLRGTALRGLPQLGFADSADGVKWRQFPQNPVIHQNDGGDGPISPWREGGMLYLFAGKSVHVMALSTSSRRATGARREPFVERGRVPGRPRPQPGPDAR